MTEGLRYKSAPDRRAALMAILAEQGFLSTVELMQALRVSDMTVRRDAQLLADQGLLRIVHGGVTILPSTTIVEYDERVPRMAESKRLVGHAAAADVRADTVIALDAGTTSLELARALSPDVAVTVVTHSAPVIGEILAKPAVSLVVLGGTLHRETLSFEGSSVLHAISQLHVDTYYLTCSGINTRGIYTANDFDAVSKRALIAAADRVVLVTDSSKFHDPALVRVSGLDAIDLAIVDDGLSQEDRELFSAAGLNLHIAESVDMPTDE